MNNTNVKAGTKIRTIVQVGMLAAIAVVLMLFEIPLPFAPSFYEIVFSEVPVMIGTFSMGPLTPFTCLPTFISGSRNSTD